ncbi:MAG: hypothetical protein JNK75_06680 [Betaproteobacteria bacterium]|nr:hypothetical protein [Betaproteobacteria bacterium]
MAFLLAMQVGPSLGQSRCPNIKSWECYGAIEMRASTPEGAVVARITRYSNGEVQAEISGEKPGDQRLLVVNPFTKMYFGVAEREILGGYAFAFFDYGFAYPAMGLEAAFPQGPSSIPAPVRSRSVQIEGNKGEISVEPVSPTRVKYRLVLREKYELDVTGYWDTAMQPPLGDSQSLSNWKSCTLRTYQSIGEARRANESCPAGGVAKK